MMRKEIGRFFSWFEQATHACDQSSWRTCHGLWLEGARTMMARYLGVCMNRRWPCFPELALEAAAVIL